MPALMACTHSRIDPASRFRILQYVPHFESAGWKVDVRPNRPGNPIRRVFRNRGLNQFHRTLVRACQAVARTHDLRHVDRFDAIAINRDLFHGDVRWEMKCHERNPHIIYDFDDRLYLGGQRGQMEWICAHAAWVIAGNPILEAFARRFTDRVTMVPTVVETERYARAGASDRTGSQVRVGWLGSDLSIRQTLFALWPLFCRLQRKLDFEFVIVSKPRPVPPGGTMRWRWVPWSPEVEENIGTHIDIGIMPLQDEPFQWGKCGTKILQYMAAGLPFVASPWGINQSLIEESGAGRMATNPTTWEDGLAEFMGSPDLRAECGERGRGYCEERYSVRAWLPIWLGILGKVRS